MTPGLAARAAAFPRHEELLVEEVYGGDEVHKDTMEVETWKPCLGTRQKSRAPLVESRLDPGRP